MINNIKNETKLLMDKAIEALTRDLNKIRTGRASLNLLDGIYVNYYGTPTPLNQIASLSVPEPRLIIIQPWDYKICEIIEKAIQKSELGITPKNDGKIIRIIIPPLTSERRKELVKIIHKIAEDAKIAIRNARRGANEILRENKKNKKISEDNSYKEQEIIQKITDDFITKINELLAEKEKEIMNF